MSMKNNTSSDDILWSPKHEQMRSCNLWRFADSYGFDPLDYDTLHRWSTSSKGEFWSSLWEFCDVIGAKGERAFVPDAQAWMTGARFFPDAEINLAENLLMKGDDDQIAVYATCEKGDYQEITRAQLRADVARVAHGLKSANIKSGDRVASVQSNGLDCLVVVLATLSIGAVWTSCSPDFGAKAIIDRIGQVAPKVLFVDLHYNYGGKSHDITDQITAICDELPCIEKIVCSTGMMSGGVAQCDFGSDFGGDVPLTFTRVPFDHPAYILYTSGTTGAPKAIVHRTGGVLLQHMKEHVLHGNVCPNDRVIWYSNTAWMMYHWNISALATGAAVVLYDGAPILKGDKGLDPSPLWDFLVKSRATHFGTSPKYLATLAAEGYCPNQLHDLSKLNTLLVCGAPCLPHQFDWVYENIKTDMVFASISGGTEIIGSFIIGSPMHSVYRGQLTVPALGHGVAVMDNRGAPVIGQRGELVCTEPFPSMPLTFWGDNGEQRYHDTYFSKWKEIWVHGDVAEMTHTGGAYVHGRSDNTLKPGGVRIGISEIYAVCESYTELEDFLVFGANHNGDEEVVLALKPTAGASIDGDFVKRLRTDIRKQASPRHVPAQIHLVSDIPYTINGKRVEGAARAVINGGDVKNLDSIRNPECLTEYGTMQRENAL